MWQFIFLFILNFLTFYFINYKYSKGIKVIAYRETESSLEAIVSFTIMVILSFLWSLYFIIY
jgi:hypothetical protein